MVHDSSCGRTAIGFVVLALAAPVLGQDPKSKAITPPDVFVHVGTVRKELEEVRFLMGMPENTQPVMIVKGAAPREVYFQALTLFEKADRFCFEHTRERAVPPPLAGGDIHPSDVYGVVDRALSCVRRVKAKYGLDAEARPDVRDDGKQPTDVFRSIVQASRQLNLMLDRRFAPSDVFQQVTRGVGYASRLLEQFPEATTIPNEPKYEKGKRPRDVYRRLLDCVERLRVIASISGLQMLELEVGESQVQRAEPSDVYDVASLIVAELAYLHSKFPDAKPPREVYYAGRKFPSHVHQRAGILERQLVELERWVKRDPTWLGQGLNSR